MTHSYVSWGRSVSTFRSRSVALTVCALAMSALPAAAQVTDAAQPSALPSLVVHKAPSAAKYGGTYHAATGTWTRRSTQARAVGSDIIYSNTAASSYFSTAGGAGGFAPLSTNFDEGVIPSTANTSTFPTAPDRDVYNINGFQINYCDFGAADSGGWEISFYESYTPCTNNPTPTATITSMGLPAGGGCWVIDIDLTGGQEFLFAGDGGDGFQDDPNLDSFGWSFKYAGTDGSGAAGHFLSGDPGSTDPNWAPGMLPPDGTGTYYGGPSPCPSGTTGLMTQDFWWLEDPTGSNSNCFFFGGYSNNNGCGSNFNPLASWHFEIYAEGLATSIGTNYCPSTPNSTGVMTELTASGSDVALDDNVCLLATNLVPGAVGFFITSETQGFVMNPGGSNGNLCVVGEVGRFLQNIQQFKTADAAGTMSLDTSIGEWSLTNIPTAVPPLFYSATAGMTTNFQLWHRDIGGSNFSNGLSISWQ